MTGDRVSDTAEDVLALTLLRGVGPVFIARLLRRFGSARAVLSASHADLMEAPGIGDATAREIIASRADVQAVLDDELRAVDQAGATLLTFTDSRYPALLRSIGDPPPLLYVRGAFDPERDAYPLAIVGSRKCSHYGVEQSGRFAGVLARAGLTIVSGGARGIDTEAHRSALRHGGRTIVVLGCGLTTCYPPENQDLLDEIVSDGRGAIISELPMRTPPDSKNFPARNRIISGLSLGVLVIEAGAKSGALITARLAAEDHNRDVFALPGRIDSPSSQGSNDLIKRGGAALVTEPADIIHELESAARHAHIGTHQWRFAASPVDDDLFAPALSQPSEPKPMTPVISDIQRRILEAVGDGATIDHVAEVSRIPIAQLRSEVTMLEVSGRLRREGSRLCPTKKART